MVAEWLHNPVTGELAHVLHADAERIDVDLWLQPGAAVARAHVHPHLTERFEVLEGELGLMTDGEERTLRPGDGAVEVPPGTVHDWWNAGDGIARVRAAVETAGLPPQRFIAAIEALWSLGALGRVGDDGTPTPLWLAGVAHEYRDAIRFVKPPPAVQSLIFGPLAAVARMSGRDVRAAELHGPDAACAIADPGEEGLAALLGQEVGARTARGR